MGESESVLTIHSLPASESCRYIPLKPGHAAVCPQVSIARHFWKSHHAGAGRCAKRQKPIRTDACGAHFVRRVCRDCPAFRRAHAPQPPPPPPPPPPQRPPPPPA